jgi:hypothetical protein
MKAILNKKFGAGVGASWCCSHGVAGATIEFLRRYHTDVVLDDITTTTDTLPAIDFWNDDRFTVCLNAQPNGQGRASPLRWAVMGSPSRPH